MLQAVHSDMEMSIHVFKGSPHPSTDWKLFVYIVHVSIALAALAQDRAAEIWDLQNDPEGILPIFSLSYLNYGITSFLVVIPVRSH